MLSGRKQRYRKVSVDTFLEIPEEMLSEESTLSTISEDAISDEDISTQLIWSYSLCRNHTLIKTYLKKTFYATYLKDQFCRSQAGKWITLKKFSEEDFWDINSTMQRTLNPERRIFLTAQVFMLERHPRKRKYIIICIPTDIALFVICSEAAN